MIFCLPHVFFFHLIRSIHPSIYPSIYFAIESIPTDIAVAISTMSLPSSRYADSAVIRLEPKYGAIICVPCGNGYPLNSIHHHLRRPPHSLPKMIRDRCLAGLNEPAFAVDWIALGVPDDDLTPIEGIKVRDGYACKHCLFRSCSDQIMRRHMRMNHQSEYSFRKVYLQCWNPTSADRYWITNLPEKLNVDENCEADNGETNACMILIVLYSL